ncbi:MerR family transcriptional regulator [Nocardia yamanashiensis]|uniref:MerR family transcriptional regulator n=1 Tax=Nocardia yamanashiensis TaxID=209247 RepID=UPI001E4C2BF7|nr:MerR family transcriptional regulator [Nocardia yamanashiensis]UGT43733.1 MerR family transcriptional regulator [Nocardia yamanashiensis]
MVGIGELARRTGVAVRTIRFYCDEGLLEVTRSAGGHRMFDGERAAERLLLVRRLRTLGLGLDSIAEVVRGQCSVGEAVAAESVRVEVEFRSLAWRRAALRAVEAAVPVERNQRLALLTAVEDGAAAYRCLVRFWQQVLAPISQREVDGWVDWNVPEPPADPSAEDVVAYAELAVLAADAGLNGAVRQQLFRHRPETIRDLRGLYSEVGGVMADVVPLVSEGVRPRGGAELDRYVGAHAGARGERDSPRFREQLLGNATDTDRRIHRYWALTTRFLGPRITVGQAHNWVYDALAGSAAAQPTGS